MKDVKSIVAQNMITLRKHKGLTQAELAEQFNYSDKAVCRWERGDTMPDINVLYSLCEFYDISMNDLVDPDFQVIAVTKQEKKTRSYEIWFSILLGSVVWLAATVWFASSLTLFSDPYWLAFVWAVPASCIMILYSLRRITNWIAKIIISSIMSWTLITAFFLHILVWGDVNVWSVFLIGLPLQALIILWNRVRKFRQAAD